MYSTSYPSLFFLEASRSRLCWSHHLFSSESSVKGENELPESFPKISLKRFGAEGGNELMEVYLRGMAVAP